MSLSKERLLTIGSLEFSGIINEMDNREFEEYCEILISFTENFPIQEAELKKLFDTGDYDSFSRVLLSVRGMLEQIQAIGLARSSLRLLDELRTQKYQISEAHLAYFLAEISALSIEIQMARQDYKPANEIDAKTSHTRKTSAFGGGGASKSILAVDDVSLTLTSLKMALKDTKYRFTGVKSGAEALQFTKLHTPDLFILDIEMPEMNGYELAEKLRNSGQAAPIIFLTGNAKEEYVIKAIKAGAADFIVKPVNNEQVLNKIKKCIG